MDLASFSGRAMDVSSSTIVDTSSATAFLAAAIASAISARRATTCSPSALSASKRDAGNTASPTAAAVATSSVKAVGFSNAAVIASAIFARRAMTFSPSAFSCAILAGSEAASSCSMWIMAALELQPRATTLE